MAWQHPCSFGSHLGNPSTTACSPRIAPASRLSLVSRGPIVVASCDSDPAVVDTLDAAGGGGSNAVSKGSGSEATTSGDSVATTGSHLIAEVDSYLYTVAGGRSGTARLGHDGRRRLDCNGNQSLMYWLPAV